MQMTLPQEICLMLCVCRRLRLRVRACLGCDAYLETTRVFFCCVLTRQRCGAEDYDGQEGAGELGDSDEEGGITAAPSLAQSGKLGS